MSQAIDAESKILRPEPPANNGLAHDAKGRTERKAMCSRVSLPEPLESLLKSEMEHCIEQANLGRYDTMIAKRYLIDQWAQIEIAAELGWNRTTVSKRIPHILRKVETAAQKLT